jgi:type I site-specific restriction-modification system R (restriction) subunit
MRRRRDVLRLRQQPARCPAQCLVHRLHRHAHREDGREHAGVFGDYISIYDIQRAVADKATVPIYYESRISKLSLNAAALPKIDAEFEEITEGEELTKKEKLKTKWAALEALVGDPKRIALVAADLVAHFEKRWRRWTARR